MSGTQNDEAPLDKPRLCDVCEDDPATHVCDDCNDNQALQSPDLDELCGDFIDNDCDNALDNVDADLDGYVDEACDGGDDCDDTDPGVFPGASETCDGVDEDCNGVVDNG